MNCPICKTHMDPVLEPEGVHPTCFEQIDEDDPFAAMLKQKLIDIIRWAETQNPRAKQVAIGPSEIGEPCDRRIGYRMAEIPAVNYSFDPWAAIMGTAIHSWLDDAVHLWMKEHNSDEWATETTLAINDFVEGHSDLYWKLHQTVIDWKGAGPDVMKKIIRDGPPFGYQIQTHIYGYGFEQAGWPVKKVALAFLPRAGWLKNMYVWTADYDRSLAEAALNRLSVIATQLVNLDILTDGNIHRWEQVEATPSNNCGWCPWYDPGREPEQGADNTGCPGR
jgi:hypothetical protein